jgi:hypothetical protein
MKIAIMVMAANVEQSTRNLDAIQNTLVKYQNEHKDKFKNEYDFYFYWSGGENLDEEVKISNSDKYDNLKFIEVKEEESVYRTFEKSIKAFDYIERNGYYDWYVRMNISMWLNIDLLDSVIGTFKPNCMYGNALNSFVNLNCAYCDDIYVRGDLMIFDRNVMNGILDQAIHFLYSDINMKFRDGIDHVDDCLIGACYINYMGAEYYKNLYMLDYTYLPDHIVPEDLKPAKYHIGTRVKTVPLDETYSGYSWDDNEYRKADCDKMYKLTQYVEDHPFEYIGLKMKDVLVDKKNSRRTLFISASGQNIFEVFHKFLEQKRKVGK